jgi:hypothetical protein
MICVKLDQEEVDLAKQQKRKKRKEELYNARNSDGWAEGRAEKTQP